MSNKNRDTKPFTHYDVSYGTASPIYPGNIYEDEAHYYNWLSHFQEIKLYAPSLEDGPHAVVDLEFNGYELRQKEQSTERVEGITPVSLGIANGIDPCPLCNGVEGEHVFLGYKEPRYMISCTRCSLRIIDDRKDKVQGKWNMRNGKDFWTRNATPPPTSTTIGALAEKFFHEDEVAKCWPKKSVIHIFKAAYTLRDKEQWIDELQLLIDERKRQIDKYGYSDEYILESTEDYGDGAGAERPMLMVENPKNGWNNKIDSIVIHVNRKKLRWINDSTAVISK